MPQYNKLEQELLNRFEDYEAEAMLTGTGDWSDREKIDHMQSIDMGNMDFGQEVVRRGGATLARYLTPENIDNVSVVHGNTTPEMREQGVAVRFNRAGEYVPTYSRATELAQSLESLTFKYGDKEYKMATLLGNETPKEESVVLYDSPGLSGDTAAHEFLHLRNDKQGKAHGLEAHLDIYALLGWKASNESEWKDSVNAYKNFLQSMDGVEVSQEEAAQRLSELISEREGLFLEEEQQAQGLLGLPRN